MAMEPKLRVHLLELFKAYQGHFGLASTTISARVSGDARFYDKLIAKTASFTVQRYDLIIATFGAIWPDELEWPEGIDRVLLEDIETRPRKRRATKPKADEQKHD